MKPIKLALLACAGSSLMISVAIAQQDHQTQPTLSKQPSTFLHDPHAQRLGVPEELGQITQALKDLLRAEYLSTNERSSLRMRHGLWSKKDLEDPINMARAALAVGVYDHPSLSHPDADRFDRALAALRQGQPQLALDLIDLPIGELAVAQLVVHAQALEMLGHNQSAITTLELIESRMAQSPITDATELSYAVEGLMQLTRLRGPQDPSTFDAKAHYQSLAKLLAHGRDNLDRLNWRIRLIEAKLLYTHNNYEEAHKAAVETLRLHPRNAEAASLIANMAIDSFNLDTAEEIAKKIDLIAAGTINSDAQQPPPTLHSAIIHARIALRRKDPEGAEYAIDQILVAMPDQRELLALNAAAAAAGFRMSSVQRLLEDYDKLSPNSPFALMCTANTLSEYRQYAYGAEMLRRTIQRAPHWGKPKLDLGLLLVQAGEDSHAKTILEEALRLDPFNMLAQNSLRLVAELASYSTIETEHFIIRYNPNSTDAVLANEMPAVLERIHQRVCSDQPGGVDHEPKRKTVIELMPNHEWFSVRIGGMPSIHAMAASTGPVIAIEAPRDGVESSVGRYDWIRVLQHEYTHTVNLSRTRNRAIHWMTEANAVYNEDSPRASQTWALLADAYENNTLFDLEKINTAFVRPKNPTDRELAYAQGAWMFEFIIERYGKDTPLKIYDASAAGRSSADAFDQVLGVTPESFLEEFRDWAHDQLLERGLILAQGIPDLAELFDTQEAQEQIIPTLESINTLLEQYPDHPQLVALQIGVALVEANTRLSPELVSMLEHAITIRPTDEAPHERLAQHFLAANTLDEQSRAIPYLEHLDAREIHSPTSAATLALLYAQTHEPERAMSKALRAVSIAPFDTAQRELAVQVALLVNNLDQAHHQLEALIQLEPDRDIHRRRLDALTNRMNQSD